MKCGFCSYREESCADSFSINHVVKRIVEAKKKSDSIVFTGGEPTINPDFINYIRYAEKLGCGKIVVETNGIKMAAPGFAEKACAAGLTDVVILMISHEPDVSDRISGLEGSWKSVIAGIESSLRAGLKTVIRIPLIADTYKKLPRHVSFIRRKFPEIEEIELFLIDRRMDGQAIIPPEKLEQVLNELEKELLPGRFKMCFAKGKAPAPCLFECPESFHSFFNFSAETDLESAGFRRVEMCEDCYIAEFCPGIHPYYAAGFPREKYFKPSPRLARRVLRQLPGRPAVQKSVGDESSFVLTLAGKKDGRTRVDEVLIRVNYTCNQRCLFCWVEPDFDNPRHEKIIEKIKTLENRETGIATITGGEPTLNPHLREYISLLKEMNVKYICLQTNAMQLSDERKAIEIAESGLDFALVSLHSHDAEISDMLTGVEGAFDKTLAGIRNLKKHGTAVMLAHVINRHNYKHLPDFVQFVHSELESTPIVFLNAAPIYGAMMHRGLVPRLSEIRETLVRALDRCLELGVRFSGLASACGIPLCILSGNTKYFPDMRPVSSSAFGSDMVKTNECNGCDLKKYCFGIRKHYLEIFGDGELKAVKIKNFKPPHPDDDFSLLFL